MEIEIRKSLQHLHIFSATAPSLRQMFRGACKIFVEDLFKALGDHGNTQITYEATMESISKDDGQTQHKAKPVAKLRGVFDLHFLKGSTDRTVPDNEGGQPLATMGGKVLGGSLILPGSPKRKVDDVSSMATRIVPCFQYVRY